MSNPRGILASSGLDASPHSLSKVAELQDLALSSAEGCKEECDTLFPCNFAILPPSSTGAIYVTGVFRNCGDTLPTPLSQWSSVLWP